MRGQRLAGVERRPAAGRCTWPSTARGARCTPIPTAQTPFLPGQRLDLATALTAYTAGSAWVNRSPAGVIEPGRPADLAVLDRDPFTLPERDIWTTQVRMTFVDGVAVHDG